MKDSRDFKKEYEAFLKKFPYQSTAVDDAKVRYQYGGKDGAPVILFLHGLEMQEMWMPYAERLEEKYRFLIYLLTHISIISRTQFALCGDALALMIHASHQSFTFCPISSVDKLSTISQSTFFLFRNHSRLRGIKC